MGTSTRLFPLLHKIMGQEMPIEGSDSNYQQILHKLIEKSKNYPLCPKIKLIEPVMNKRTHPSSSRRLASFTDLTSWITLIDSSIIRLLFYSHVLVRRVFPYVKWVLHGSLTAHLIWGFSAYSKFYYYSFSNHPINWTWRNCVFHGCHSSQAGYCKR